MSRRVCGVRILGAVSELGEVDEGLSEEKHKGKDPGKLGGDPEEESGLGARGKIGARLDKERSESDCGGQTPGNPEPGDHFEAADTVH